MSYSERKAAYIARLTKLRANIEEHYKCSRAVLRDFAVQNNSPCTWDDVLAELDITINLLK